MGLLHPIKNKTKTTQPTKTKTTTYSKVIVRKSKPIYVRCGSFAIYSATSFDVAETCVSFYECAVYTTKSSYNGQYFI